MKQLASALVGAALLLAPMPAFAHHKTGHRDFIGRGEQTQVHERRRDPCNSVSNNPHESNARQAMQQRCRQMRAALRQNPDDAALRADCDQAARALTGQPC